MNTVKIILYIGACLSFIPLSITCQDGFKKIISYNDSRSLNFDDIQFENDKIYISGNAFIDSVKLWSQSFAVFDTNGILLWQKTYLDTNANIVSNTPSRFFISNNGDFIIPCNFFERDNLGIKVIDSVGKELLTYEYNNYEFTIYPEDVIEFYNNIYAFGTIQRSNYKDDNYIIKIDLNGKFQWIKYYGLTNTHESFGDVIDNNDGTFTISSNRYSEEFNIEPFGSHGWIQPWIFTVDTSGEITRQWLGLFNDTKTHGGGPFYHMKNGDWIIISHEFKEDLNHNTASAPTITKLNSEFGLEWKLYLADYTSFWDQLLDLEFDSIRNEFVTVGHRFVKYNEDYTELEVWVVKFNPEGDILWNISDTIWSDRINIVKNFTAGVDISPSGSIYVGGTIEHYHNPSRSFGWILKLNPDGCFDTLCLTTQSKDAVNDVEKVVIYPNPTTSKLSIQLGEEWENSGEVKISIVDQLGRICFEDNFQAGPSSHSFSLDQLPVGIYFLTVQSGQKWFATKVSKL